MEYTEDDIIQLAIEAELVFNTEMLEGKGAHQWHIDRLVKFVQLFEQKYLSKTQG